MSPSPADLDASNEDGAPAELRELTRGADQRSKWRWVGGLLLLGLLGAGGAWMATSESFGSSEDAVAPAPAAGNLLGEAWSFESTETTSPHAAWLVPDEAPVGFSFPESSAVTGRAGARALLDEEPWARIVSAETFSISPAGGLIQVSGTSNSDTISLMVRFLAEGHPPIDTVLASGSGRLVGHAQTPPGATAFRVGVNAVGEGSIDDLDVRFVATADADESHGAGALTTGSPFEHGLYSVFVGDPRGLTVFHGEQFMLRIEPASLRTLDGVAIPGSAGLLPGTGEVAVAGGERAQLTTEIVRDDLRLVLKEKLSGIPLGATLEHQAVVAGALAEAPLGVRSARGFERFTGDFRVEGVHALLMGPTRSRLVLEMGAPFNLSATHRANETVALSIERSEPDAPGSEEMTLNLSIQAEFKEERVAAAQLRDSAEAHEKAGRLGAALADIEVIVTVYPYDEAVLESGLAARTRIQGVMQERLDALDTNLEDALFLGSAERCREVHEEALAEVVRFAGCEAEALFLQRAANVEQRAARLLEEDVLRRRQRVEALADSYAADGGYPLLADELQRYLDEHLTLVIAEGQTDADQTSSPAGETTSSSEEAR
ncbi:MAG: hypothetical protein P8N09_01635 [Planctomycetota bacterium]|nr:hypothetical protein [Planctomycetota bacterium]